MFGACTRQLFTSVIGIGQAKDTAGYRDVVICPQIPKQMQFAKGSIETQNGTISVNWYKEDNQIHFEIQLPEATKGVFRYGTEEWKLQGGQLFQKVLPQ